MGDAELRYYGARQFSAQWRATLMALAGELFDNFSEEEALGFFRQIGIRLSRDLQLPVVETLEALEAAINTRLAEMDWGVMRLTVEDAAIAIHHNCYPGQFLDLSEADAWRKAFSAILEGLYTVWLQTQGGRAEMAARRRDGSDLEGFEFAYGL
ncbi:hypothetical protein LRS10_21840 [Phenylobacterium sp. J426]|uniref:cellulose biosynthesis protein BcsD n=1 Tax=Phenylobacterium sp. J426 TaxID=2898439 RepID=UPI002150BD80|nr:cellulose biosynthesis protein BcsD [Phenylobacterium sp. J426]MCR5876554.1 hypothetical protein [Phenylobacterium sp. J426]